MELEKSSVVQIMKGPVWAGLIKTVHVMFLKEDVQVRFEGSRLAGVVCSENQSNWQESVASISHSPWWQSIWSAKANLELRCEGFILRSVKMALAWLESALALTPPPPRDVYVIWTAPNL